jgi:hypothetical protein
LPPEFKKNLIPVLEGVHLIVIGYGGYDTGIMDYLRETTSRKPIYWCPTKWVIVLLMLLIHHLLYLVFYLTPPVSLGISDTGIMDYLPETTSRKPIYWCCRDKSRLSAETKKLLTEQDFIVEIKGFGSF